MDPNSPLTHARLATDFTDYTKKFALIREIRGHFLKVS